MALSAPFIRSKLEIMALEANDRRVQAVKEVGCNCCTDLKKELQLMKEKLDNVVDEIWRLKQPAQAMPALKTEVEKKNMQIMVDSFALAHAFVGFAGVLIGVVAARLLR